MIKIVDWEEILDIWETELWPNRISPIEPTSAMKFLQGYDMKNMSQKPSFFAFIVDEKILGVNSGHMCMDKGYRSRGLWVDPKFRRQGIGQQLLHRTIEQAKIESARYVWSYPRKTSWSTYAKSGFELASNWGSSETSDNNAYCIKVLG